MPQQEEQHGTERHPSHNSSGSTTSSSFDELAKGLAEGSISRRRALKLFAGTALAALIPSRALADDDCVRICHVPFDRETRECDFANAETRCVSRRERRRHLENHPCDCQGRCRNCLTPACQPVGGNCTADSECCSEICDTNSSTCAECQSGGGPCRGCCSFACINDVCIPPGGDNLLRCNCVGNAGSSFFCTSVACGSSDVHQLCVALCASSGGLASYQCSFGC
jgi:hypothetical protein